MRADDRFFCHLTFTSLGFYYPCRWKMTDSNHALPDQLLSFSISLLSYSFFMSWHLIRVPSRLIKCLHVKMFLFWITGYQAMKMTQVKPFFLSLYSWYLPVLACQSTVQYPKINLTRVIFQCVHVIYKFSHLRGWAKVMQQYPFGSSRYGKGILAPPRPRLDRPIWTSARD